jgi:hypothetical protein
MSLSHATVENFLLDKWSHDDKRRNKILFLGGKYIL